MGLSLSMRCNFTGCGKSAHSTLCNIQLHNVVNQLVTPGELSYQTITVNT